MPSLPTLVPTSQVAAGDWTDEGGGTTDLHLAIDETGAAGTDYIRGALNALTGVGTWHLTDTPSDFGTMTSIDIEIRHSRGGVEAGDNGGGDDTHTLLAQIFDSGASALTDEMTIETGTVGYLAKTEVVSFTGVVAGDKTTWDGARLALRTTFSQSMGADGDRVWVDFARIINGVYEVSDVPIELESDPVGASTVTAPLKVDRNVATAPAGVGAETAALKIERKVASAPSGVGAVTTAVKQEIKIHARTVKRPPPNG